MILSGILSGTAKAPASLTVLIVVSGMPLVTSLLMLDYLSRVSRPSEVSDQIRDAHGNNGFSVDRFGIRSWFDLFIGRHFLPTMSAHSSMLST